METKDRVGGGGNLNVALASYRRQIVTIHKGHRDVNDMDMPYSKLERLCSLCCGRTTLC